MIGALTEVATTIANDPLTVRGFAPGSDATRALFDFLASLRARSPHPGDIAVTVYDDVGLARAWSGRPSDIPRERTSGAQDLFVQRSALGLRLVHVHPITGADSRRMGTVAVEHVLSRVVAGAALASSDESFPTAIAPVALRLRSEGAGEGMRPGTFVLRTPANQTLVEASVSTTSLQRVRAMWRRTVVALGRRHLRRDDAPPHWTVARRSLAVPRSTRVRCRHVGASLLLAAGAAAIWIGLRWSTEGRQGLAVNLTFVGGGLAALAAIWAAPATLVPYARRTSRRTFPGETPRFVVMHLLAGVAVATCLLSIARVRGDGGRPIVGRRAPLLALSVEWRASAQAVWCLRDPHRGAVARARSR